MLALVLSACAQTSESESTSQPTVTTVPQHVCPKDHILIGGGPAGGGDCRPLSGLCPGGWYWVQWSGENGLRLVCLPIDRPDEIRELTVAPAVDPWTFDEVEKPDLALTPSYTAPADSEGSE